MNSLKSESFNWSKLSLAIVKTSKTCSLFQELSQHAFCERKFEILRGSHSLVQLAIYSSVIKKKKKEKEKQLHDFLDSLSALE